MDDAVADGYVGRQHVIAEDGLELVLVP